MNYFMSLKNLFLVTLFLAFFNTTNAQHVREDYNLLGLQGGVTLFNIETNHFNTKQGTGFALGFVTRGDFYNNFDLEYGITFFQNELGILGRDFTSPINGFDERYIDYTLSSVQVKFLGSYNLVGHYLSLDFGPILNVNGKLKPNQEAQENYVLDGYETLKASDIENISRVHLHVAGGITVGLTHFRLNVQYQYGVTNVFNRFNDSEALATAKPEGGFKGNVGMWVFGGYVFF